MAFFIYKSSYFFPFLEDCNFTLQASCDVFQFLHKSCSCSFQTNIDCGREHHHPIHMSNIKRLWLLMELPLPAVAFICTFRHTDYVDSCTEMATSLNQCILILESA